MSVDVPLRIETTSLLERADSPEAPSLRRLMPIIYDELRDMAHRHLAREHGTPRSRPPSWSTRPMSGSWTTSASLAAAARAIRQILVEAARRRNAAKRGGGERPVTLEEGHATVDAYASELLDLDAALSELESRSPRQARVVEYRYFGGLGVEETAAALDVSPRTVKTDWAVARAWLYTRLNGPGAERRN